MSLDQAERRLSALAHDIAKLAGEDQLAGAGHFRRLDEEDFAADRSPREAGDDAGHAGAHGDLAAEALGAEQLMQVVEFDMHMVGGALGDLHGDVAQGAADLALEVANAGLAREGGDDPHKDVIVDLDLFGLQPVGLQLAADQIAPRDLQLFARRVTGQRDDLHAIAHGAWDGIEDGPPWWPESRLPIY